MALTISKLFATIYSKYVFEFLQINGGDTMDFYKRALELREETVRHRRWMHKIEPDRTA